jgi:hypothetical protein
MLWSLRKSGGLPNIVSTPLQARKIILKGIKCREEPGIFALSLHPQVVTSRYVSLPTYNSFSV